MQSALRDLVQHSIDMYRREQDVMSLAHQTGVTTPTLLPVPIPPAPAPAPPAQPVPVPVPGVPHSHSIPHANPSINAPTQLGFPAVIGQQNNNINVNVNDYLFGALLLVAAPALKEYATTPLFQDALCYSQAAIFTCSSSNSFSCCMQKTTTTTTSISSPATTTTTTGGVRIQRPDLSTLVLTTSRLVTALEWVRTREEGYNRICPREVWDVADCGMREVRERIEDGTSDYVLVKGFGNLIDRDISSYSSLSMERPFERRVLTGRKIRRGQFSGGFVISISADPLIPFIADD
jgi:hypothetical protein